MTKFGVDQLTLRDLEVMTRPKLMENLNQIASFISMPLDRSQIEALSDSDLRQLVARARRKFQGLGY